MIKPLNHFQSPEQKTKRLFFRSLIEKIIVAYKIRRYIINTPLNFVISSPDFITNIFITYICKKKGVLLIIERLDENRRKFIENKSIIDHIGTIYDNLSDCILKQKHVILFVISNYLEKKYRTKFPLMIIERTPPSMIDLVEFENCSNNSLVGQLNSEIIESLHSTKIKFCFAGSCVFTNGLIFTLECLAEIKNKGFDFLYYLLIHKGFTGQLQDKINELSLNDNVFLINGLYPDFIPAFYKQIDVLILPEMGNEVAEAGFPGKTSEYLASGKAIIATKFSNINDYLINGRNCLMCTIGDKTQYVENIKNLIIDSDLRTHLGKNALLTAQNFFDYKNSIRPIVQTISKNCN